MFLPLSTSALAICDERLLELIGEAVKVRLKKCGFRSCDSTRHSPRHQIGGHQRDVFRIARQRHHHGPTRLCEQPDGGLLDKVVSGVGVGHGSIVPVFRLKLALSDLKLGKLVREFCSLEFLPAEKMKVANRTVELFGEIQDVHVFHAWVFSVLLG